jgi:hypothetical protein
MMGKRMAIPATGLVLASLSVAACGSSSSASSGGPGITTTTAANQRADVAACMRKQGVTLPARPNGTGRPGGATGPRAPRAGGGTGGFLFGGAGAGRGQFNNPKFQAAAKKCGLAFNRNGAGAGGAQRFNPTSNPQFKKSLTKFVACVRKNGYDLPSPNLTGNGPVFDAGKVNRNDPKFTKAAQKCQSLLSLGRGTTGQGGPPPAQ